MKDLSTGKVEITSQNHNFVVDLESLERSEHGDAVEVTHVNLNDRTVEGIRTGNCRSSASSTTPRRARAPTTPPTCSAASSR